MNDSMAVIVAAGLGSRLRPLTSDLPKCMLEIQNKPMLHRALDTFRNLNISRSVVIGGYKVEKLELPDDCELIINDQFSENNILHSLAYARQAMQHASTVIVTYSDIVFTTPVVRQLMNGDGADITIVVDQDWRRRYEGRDQHPLAEAEGAHFDNTGRIQTIRKGLVTLHSNPNHCGEFIGMMKFTHKGQEIFWNLFDEVNNRFGLEDPFQRAPAWRLAYITDLLQELVDRDGSVQCSLIQGNWLEIDTLQDYEYAAGFDFSGEDA